MAAASAPTFFDLLDDRIGDFHHRQPAVHGCFLYPAESFLLGQAHMLHKKAFCLIHMLPAFQPVFKLIDLFTEILDLLISSGKAF